MELEINVYFPILPNNPYKKERKNQQQGKSSRRLFQQ